MESDLKPELWTESEWNLGWYLSAALEDEGISQDFRQAIEAWFNELEKRSEQ